MKQTIWDSWQKNGILSMINCEWKFSNEHYGARNEIFYNTDVLKSNLCDYNDAYVLVRGDIAIAGRNLSTEVAFKNCALIEQQQMVLKI